MSKAARERPAEPDFLDESVATNNLTAAIAETVEQELAVAGKPPTAKAPVMPTATTTDKIIIPKLPAMTASPNQASPSKAELAPVTLTSQPETPSAEWASIAEVPLVMPEPEISLLFEPLDAAPFDGEAQYVDSLNLSAATGEFDASELLFAATEYGPNHQTSFDELVDGMTIDLSEFDPATMGGESPAAEQFMEAITHEPRQQAELSLFDELKADFGSLLANLEPVEVENFALLVESLSDAIDMLREPTDEMTEEAQIEIKQQIVELCIQAFETLGVSYNRQAIVQFVEATLLSASNNATDAEIRYSLGTHEFKSLKSPALLSNFARFIQQKVESHSLLGKYTLQACSV